MTIVSHAHRFLFLKTHKTAGTSVDMMLEPLCRPPGWIVTKKTGESHTEFNIFGRRHGGKAKPFRLFNWYDHMTASGCRRAIGRKKWDSYAKITTVRDPFDRVLSHFFWRKKDVDPNGPDHSQTIADFFDQKMMNIVHRRLAWIFDNFDYPPLPDSSADITKVTS